MAPLFDSHCHFAPDGDRVVFADAPAVRAAEAPAAAAAFVLATD